MSNDDEMIIRITIQGKNVEDAFVVLPNGSRTISIEKIHPGDEKYNEITKKGSKKEQNHVEKVETSKNNHSTNNSKGSVLNEKLSFDKTPRIHKSITPSFDVPNTSITDCILTNARKSEIKKKNAYIRGLTKSISISYAQFTRGVFKLAKGLLEKGFQKGDVASLYLLNLHEYALIFHAVILLGGIVHPTLLKLDEVQLYNQYKVTKPRFIFTLHKNNMFINAKNAAEKVGGNTGEFIVYLDVSQTNEGTKFVDLFMNDGKGFEHRVEGTDIVVSNPSKTPSTHIININPQSDLALIAFDENNVPTSYTHHNLVSQIHQLDKFYGEDINGEDIFLVSAPYSSVFGLQMFMNFPLYKCSTIVILPPINKENFIEHVSHFKVTVSSLPPSLSSKLSNSNSDLSSLRYLFLTSPFAISSSSRNDISKLFKGTSILGCHADHKFSGLALSETPSKSSNSGSCGSLLPNVEAKVLDLHTGLSVKDGELGELFLKGPNVITSKHNTSLSKLFDEDGFFRTKLIAKVEKNVFTIYDHLDSVIFTDNFTLFPSQIEKIMLGHEEVREAYFYQENGAYHFSVVLTEGSEIPSSDLSNFISSKLPHKITVSSINIDTSITRKTVTEWDYTN